MLQTQDNGWDAVRYTVDHRRKMGQFILTGSAVPDKNAEKEMEHPGSFLVKARRETKRITLSTKSFLIHTDMVCPIQLFTSARRISTLLYPPYMITGTTDREHQLFVIH